MIIEDKIQWFNGHFRNNQTFKGCFQNKQIFKGNFGVITKVVIGDHDWYDGEYVVDPAFTEQTLETKLKLMSDDVTVNPIQVEYAANESGGNTVFIGGNISG